MRDKNLQCAARQAIVFFIGRSDQFSMRKAATARFTIMILSSESKQGTTFHNLCYFQHKYNIT